MKYTVVILRRARKELLKLSKKDQKRIDNAIDVLQTDPFCGKQLYGEFEGKWALRVWPYRIIYTIEQDIVTVTILRVGHRQGVYK